MTTYQLTVRLDREHADQEIDALGSVCRSSA
jgi:hypothetical protein